MSPKRPVKSPVSDPVGLAYLDGQILSLDKARIGIQDRGFLLGDGVFETLRVTNGKVFRLDDHAKRLRTGLAAIHLDASIVDEFYTAVDAMVNAGVKKMGDDLYIRFMVTTGPLEDLNDTGRGLTVAGICKKFKPYPLAFYSKGIHVVRSRQRKDTTNPLSTIKSLSFLPYITARREALAQAVHDAILLNEHGRVAEASTSNVFARKGDTVYAPGAKEGALPGITRDAVLELLDEAGFDVKESLSFATWKRADEAWFTNTTGGVIPVTRFADQPIGKGRKGDLTSQLSHGLEALLRA